jgi:hypothetical protein
MVKVPAEATRYGFLSLTACAKSIDRARCHPNKNRSVTALGQRADEAVCALPELKFARYSQRAARPASKNMSTQRGRNSLSMAASYRVRH